LTGCVLFKFVAGDSCLTLAVAARGEQAAVTSGADEVRQSRR
jgi:hypothetical protein